MHPPAEGAQVGAAGSVAPGRPADHRVPMVSLLAPPVISSS
jgi:hypothetical protein